MEEDRVSSLLDINALFLARLEAEMTHFGTTKQFDGRFAAVKRPFLCLDLLKAYVVCPLIEVVQARPCPLLVRLRVFMLQPIDVLG